MKIAIYTLASAVAIANAQLLNLSRLRASAGRDEWGRNQPRRVQVQRVLEASISLSMSMDFDTSISMFSFDDSSVSMSMSTSMSVETDVMVPDEPEIILDGGVLVVSVVPTPDDSEGDLESTIPEDPAESLDDNVDVDGDEGDFVDGDFKEQKLEANTATASLARSAVTIMLAYSFTTMI